LTSNLMFPNSTPVRMYEPDGTGEGLIVKLLRTVRPMRPI
jgi:hypothetical protein